MSHNQPRLRMFAGPNGSGKSSLKELLPVEMQGVYLNPDELERELRDTGVISLGKYKLNGHGDDLIKRMGAAGRPGNRNFAELIQKGDECDSLKVDAANVDAYLASALIEGMREELILKGESFTFETVMSHPSKVEVLRRAKNIGYRTYLYYVATEDADINVSRVANRVAQGGHPVPEDKIRNRYKRSLSLLYEAIQQTNRAYIFDNSGEGSPRSWIAEVTEGLDLVIKASSIPNWFKEYVLDKL